jgi:DNA-binding NarL/FixJ family response regulator
MADASVPVRAKRRVLVVDDHPIVRQGLRLILEAEDDLVVAGEAADALEALRLVEADPPDLALVDMGLRNSSGIELVKDLHVRFPDLPVLVMSAHDESVYAERVLRAGARGYLMKGTDNGTILAAVRKVLDGELYVSGRVSARLLTKFVTGRGSGGLEVESLSDRELEVFEHIGRGLGTREIAARLSLSIKTVESYRESIKRKLVLADATALVQSAIHWVQGDGTRS